jgi:hypothetical protein
VRYLDGCEKKRRVVEKNMREYEVGERGMALDGICADGGEGVASPLPRERKNLFQVFHWLNLDS